MSTVFTNDVGIVAAGIIKPIPFKIHFIREDAAAQGTKGTKGIGREEGASGRIKGDHGLRPVDHRRGDKGNGVLSEFAGIAFGNHFGAVIHAEPELTHEIKGFLITDDLGLRVTDEDFLKACRVVRFHMVDNQVIQGTASKDGFDIFQELTADRPVSCIEKNRFFVQKDVGIVGYAPRNGMNIFKKFQAAIVSANPVQIFR